MDLPRWNNEWDPPDPLKGRPGWGRHHFVTGVVFVLLLVGIAGLVIPAVHQYRRVEIKLDRDWERQWEARGEEIDSTTRPP